eukprot:5653322-Pyramimonas_sp.AAC.1
MVLVTKYEQLLGFKQKEAVQPKEPPLQVRAHRAPEQVQGLERKLGGAIDKLGRLRQAALDQEAD